MYEFLYFQAWICKFMNDRFRGQTTEHFLWLLGVSLQHKYSVRFRIVWRSSLSATRHRTWSCCWALVWNANAILFVAMARWTEYFPRMWVNQPLMIDAALEMQYFKRLLSCPFSPNIVYGRSGALQDAKASGNRIGSSVCGVIWLRRQYYLLLLNEVKAGGLVWVWYKDWKRLYLFC